MRYLILGSAEARDDNGNPLPLGGPRLRALLTALAMRAARPAPTAVDVLIDEVWTQDPPQDAPAALQALVGRLRRAIGRDAVVSSPGGYRLATGGPQDVDLLHFEALTKHGTRALGAGDPKTAADVLRQALALWRGPALADLPDREAAAARPDALRLTALHRRIDADLALGHAADVIPELRELGMDHPLDETFHAQLIRALHAAGRPADALAAYEAVRRTLADRLGTDPGADLKALHGLLLSGGPVQPSAGTGVAAVRRPGGPAGPGARGGQGAGGAREAARGSEAAYGAGVAHGGRDLGAEAGARSSGDEAGRGPYGLVAPSESEPTRAPYAAHGPSGAARDSEGARAAQTLDGGHPDRDPEAPHGPGTPGGMPGGPAAAGYPARGPGAAHGAAAAGGSAVPRDPGAVGGAAAVRGGADALGPNADRDSETPNGGGPTAGYAARAPEVAQGGESAAAGYAARTPEVAQGGESAAAAYTARTPELAYGGVSAAAGYAAHTPEANPGTARPAGAAHGTGTAPTGAPPVPSNGEPRPGGPQGAGTRPRGNLRARLTSFVGRQSEIGDLRGDLSGARLVTLTGPGGSGKTRLSEEAAATVTNAYPDGVWVAELAKLDHPAAVPGAVLSAVGDRETSLLATGLEGRIGPADGSDPTARLVELCAHRRLLLLLDNCEHVIDAAARLAETLLAHCPGVTVLATSREPLGVPGETVRPVEPLRPAPAHQLFAERASATLPGFDPARDPDTSAAVAEICRRLDGLPLAIELAAARLRLLTPRQIADRLDDRFRLLTSGSRTVLPRQQTLRAVVEWSWDLLDERERTVLRRASVFAGGWGLSAAEAVCADAARAPLAANPPATNLLATNPPAPAPPAADPPVTDPSAGPGARPRPHIAPDEVLDLLAALVDKSLLVVDHPAAGPAPAGPAGASAVAPSEVRYRMLETIHEYVGERATEDPAARADHAAAVARHTACFRDFARTAEPRLRSAEQLPWLHRVEAELDNVRAAMKRSLEARDEQTAIEFITAMSWFWWMRNYRDEGIAWAREALLLGGATGRDDTYSVLGTIPEGVPPGQDGVDEVVTRYWDQMDLRLLVFFMNADNADAPMLASPEVVTAARRIRDAYRAHPSPRAARFPGMLWPFAGFVLDGHAGVIPLMNEAVVQCRAYGDDWAVGVALMFRTHMAIDLSGGMKNAEADWAELRELSRRVGDRWMLAQVETAAGEMAASRARLDEARTAYELAQRLAREIGAHAETPFLITRLADVAINIGDLDRAEKLLDHSDQEAGHRGIRDVLSFNRSLRSLIELQRGNLARARMLCDEARRTGEQATPPPQFWMLVDGMDARITADEGDAPGALRKVRDNLSRGAETGCMELLLAQQAETAAHVLVGCEEERLAARMLGAADAWRGELPRTPLPLRETEKAAAATHRALGREAAQALRAEGTGLSVEQVIALLDELVTAA
ncbi:BTAD domain-containing putative transcriptional regulator [Streptomyces sp. ME19-01-6]|uniref:BTAD domain-containing putative transcriptional regulator n=1 Tax=Streptomyces sp. ME19-01-6 TaxID=3028686 RepID=UPI0029A8E538|nr:BTAD domain-containing putative transcriptional regulator [Streptomyces sp. ME19-01-6]MDX3233930.1 BTAD domain-containing putative transcriptional regulator [Streptomyces sp. ME19-01-6]